LGALAEQVRQFQQVLQQGVDRLEAINGSNRKPDDADGSEDRDNPTPPALPWTADHDDVDVASSTAALVDARAAWLQHLHASSAAFIHRTERGDEGATWWKAPQPEGYRSFQLETIRLLASQPGRTWSDAARCLQMTHTFLRPQRPLSARNIWFVVAALLDRPHEHVTQDPSPIHPSRHWKGRHEMWRDRDALLDELPHDELLRSREVLRDVLRAAFEPAWWRLRALLLMRESLTPEQKAKLEALVGTEWRRLGDDVDRYTNWSGRASALLQTIEHTPQGALSDIDRTVILSEARRAVEEANVVATQFRVRGYAAEHGSPYRSVRSVEDSDISMRGLGLSKR
jgi:hypothetical protein